MTVPKARTTSVATIARPCNWDAAQFLQNCSSVNQNRISIERRWS
jgi:hypothetical protein